MNSFTHDPYKSAQCRRTPTHTHTHPRAVVRQFRFFENFLWEFHLLVTFILFTCDYLSHQCMDVVIRHTNIRTCTLCLITIAVDTSLGSARTASNRLGCPALRRLGARFVAFLYSHLLNLSMVCFIFVYLSLIPGDGNAFIWAPFISLFRMNISFYLPMHYSGQSCTGITPARAVGAF